MLVSPVGVVLIGVLLLQRGRLLESVLGEGTVLVLIIGGAVLDCRTFLVASDRVELQTKLIVALLKNVLRFLEGAELDFDLLQHRSGVVIFT